MPPVPPPGSGGLRSGFRAELQKRDNRIRVPGADLAASYASERQGLAGGQRERPELVPAQSAFLQPH